MDLTEYRNSDQERERIEDLLDLAPSGLTTALDVGARDGFIAKRLAADIDHVTALDLETPQIDGERVRCVAGDVTRLAFDDDTFELVLCAEVLEHIPPESLQLACSELMRVSSRYVLIGVPYKQDIRLGRTTCAACGGRNPPWGHINQFDEERLAALFAPCMVWRTSFVGTGEPRTNWIATALMDAAGNPYGTYFQEEPCVHCGAELVPPSHRSLLSRVLSKVGLSMQRVHILSRGRHPNWIHMLFAKPPSDGQVASTGTSPKQIDE